MRKDLLMLAMGLCLASGPVAADDLAMPGAEAAAEPAMESAAPDAGMATPPDAPREAPPDAPPARPELPAKGITMAAVEKKYGKPITKRPPVGGDSPKHPPITRWDYARFSVIFEKDRVIDAVVPGAPPRLYHKDQLTPVAASAAPMPPPAPMDSMEEMAPPAEEMAPPPAPESAADAEPMAPEAEPAMAPEPEPEATAEAPAEAPAPAPASPAPKPAPAPAPPPATYPDAPADDGPPTPK